MLNFIYFNLGCKSLNLTPSLLMLLPITCFSYLFLIHLFLMLLDGLFLLDGPLLNGPRKQHTDAYS